MLVGIWWFGLYGYFFSSIIIFKVQFSSLYCTYRSTAFRPLWSDNAQYQFSLTFRFQVRLLLSWTSADEAVGNMQLFNNHLVPLRSVQFSSDHSGSRGLSRFIKGIHWATGLFLRTPFTEGCAGANKKASPPGRQRRCTFRPTTFSSAQ